jgi:hypothetical protein
MIGLFVIGILGLWVWFAIWLAKKLSSYLWRNSNTQRLTTTFARWITVAMLSLLFILLPFIDQLIAYPKWQQMCATTGDFEWGPNMDEKKAFGRELIVTSTTHETSIFPNIHITYFSTQFKDVKTGELVLNMPHSEYYKAKGMFYLPSSSGDSRAIFLSTCSTSSNSKAVIDYVSQYKLTIIGYK